MAIPLNLSSRQQTLLANVAAEIGRAVYDVKVRHQDEPSKLDWDAEVKQLGEAILTMVLDTTAQEWHEMYDKLHRSGANF